MKKSNFKTIQDKIESTKKRIERMKKYAIILKPIQVSKVLGELTKSSSMLRDIFNDTFTSIQVDDEDLYLKTKEYLQEIAPDKASIVKHYQSKDLPLFEKYNVESVQ